jgi:beta-ureidopropionase / N-carbamoyl-L-amino-acid hydrolase
MLEALVHRIAEEDKIEAEIAMLWSIDPITFHPHLVEFGGADSNIVETRRGLRHAMPSGPMHDSAEMARGGIPAIMKFTPSLYGLAHNHI